MSGSPCFGGGGLKNLEETTYPNIIIDSHVATKFNEHDYTMPNRRSSKIISSDIINIRKAHSLESTTRRGSSNFEKMKTFFDDREKTDLFKRKIRIIRRHFKHTSHPLRILLDLFAVQLKEMSQKNYLS